jgi:type IV pilus assembly protein PilM
VVVVDHSGAEPEVTHLSYTPLIADAIVEGEIMDPQLIVETIRSVFDAMGSQAKRVVASVGGRDVIVKKIQMDRMKEDDAREVIRWEAEQHVPFDMENVQLDFQILDPAGDGLQMNVLLVAAKRELVEQKVGLLKEAGLSPRRRRCRRLRAVQRLRVQLPGAMEGSSCWSTSATRSRR